MGGFLLKMCCYTKNSKDGSWHCILKQHCFHFDILNSDFHFVLSKPTTFPSFTKCFSNNPVGNQHHSTYNQITVTLLSCHSCGCIHFNSVSWTSLNDLHKTRRALLRLPLVTHYRMATFKPTVF
jgi:hypothetical protein